MGCAGDAIKRKFRSRPDYLAMAARVEDEYIFPMRDASTNKRNVARDLKKLEKETDEGRSDLTSAAIKRQADILMENGDKAGVASLYRGPRKSYSAPRGAFEALMGQYYRYVLREPRLLLSARQGGGILLQPLYPDQVGRLLQGEEGGCHPGKIAGYYEKGGNEKKAASLRKDAEKREKNSKKGIREEG